MQSRRREERRRQVRELLGGESDGDEGSGAPGAAVGSAIERPVAVLPVAGEPATEGGGDAGRERHSKEGKEGKERRRDKCAGPFFTKAADSTQLMLCCHPFRGFHGHGRWAGLWHQCAFGAEKVEVQVWQHKRGKHKRSICREKRKHKSKRSRRDGLELPNGSGRHSSRRLQVCTAATEDQQGIERGSELAST